MTPETVDDWLAWQTRLHTAEIELGLERVREVWMRLQQGTLPGKVITVAGTNGKGSSVAFLDAILRAGGYRTGCYTSPHLMRYNERIKVRGEEVTDSMLCDAFARVEKARRDTPLTYFEFGTLAALDIFCRSELDVIILEVGLGGRLDAVNILDADVALISTVDLDHSEWLGATREEVGREKAGIMRRHRPAVFGGGRPPDSLVEVADHIGASLYVLGEDYHFTREGHQWRWWAGAHRRYGLPIPSLRGSHQLHNAAACLMVLQLLAETLPVDQSAVRTGLRSAMLPGRFQVLGRDPCVILDVAHNREAAVSLADNLKAMFCAGRTRAVFGVLADKDIGQIIMPLKSLIDHWYLGGLDSPRASPVGETAQILTGCGIEADDVSCERTLPEALNRARKASSTDDRILVFGSFFTVSAALSVLQRDEQTDVG